MAASIRGVLEEILPADSILPHGELDRWRIRFGGKEVPEAVLAPATEEEVARVLEKASQEGWKVLPAGLGSWLGGGGGTEATLFLSTRRLDQIHEYEPADLTFTAGGGFPVRMLRERTSAHGQWLPLDPPGSLRGSLGAVAALGMGGSLRHLYGTPRDHVLGLTLVSGDGRILSWGGRVVKNVAGFDLTRLTVGSWGALGVVTSVSVRLFPVPERDLTLVVPGQAARELLPLARAMALSPLPLAGVDLVAPCDGISWGEADLDAVLVLRLLGSRAQVAEMESRVLREMPRVLGALRRLDGEGSRRFHDGMDGWERGCALVVRLCLLPSSLNVLLDEAEEMKELASGLGVNADTRLSAHLGAGILRVGISKLPEEESSLAAWVTHLRKARSRLENQGGSLTLSSGPDSLMREVGPWGSGEPSASLMARIKNQFDPAGILAPGRFGLG